MEMLFFPNFCLSVSMNFLKLLHFSLISGSAPEQEFYCWVSLEDLPPQSYPSLRKPGLGGIFELQRQALKVKLTFVPAPLLLVHPFPRWALSGKVSCNYRGLWHNNSPARQFKTGSGLIHPKAISQHSLELGQPGSQEQPP